MSDLDVTAEWDGGICRVRARGEARLETSAAFERVRNEIRERGVTRVMVDLSDVEFMDSASTGTLISLRAQLAECDGSLVLHGMRGPVTRLFERTGLLEQFVCVDSAEEAEALLV